VKFELPLVDPEMERRQRERTRSLRVSRDAATATTALDEVRRVAESDANLLPPMRDALSAGCTIGEICGALRELWGTYDAQHA
jgi:methylmalonyl-CoA mutase N-terminal domain/subunit